MLVLKAIPHETIWGGKKLKPYAEGKYEKIGHLYSLMDDNGQSNLILNGEHRGKSFHSYFVENRERFRLESYSQFPLIIAMVETADNLSIQVHPDDKAAKEEEGREYGKNESWHFLEAPASGSIYNGCLCKTVEEAEEKLEKGNAEEIADRLSVARGDYVYVEAGTLHALSAGSFLYEIEENCELTYRVYDFGRLGEDGKPREIHMEKALKALKPRLKSVSRQLKADVPVEERRYVLSLLQRKCCYQNNSSTLECITFLKGQMVLDGIKAVTGTCAVLEPGERIDGVIELAMMARPCLNEGKQ